MTFLDRAVLIVAAVAASTGSAALATEYTLNTLTAFNGTNGKGPAAGLIADAEGNLYGTTAMGGVNNDGTVFEIAAGTHALSTLATFNGANGSTPLCNLIIDASGNLYGTTAGNSVDNNGTVFEVSAGTHALSTLAIFNLANGGGPSAGLLADASGNLYGTTREGGANNLGTVFELAAGTHVLSTLVTFIGSNGQYPSGALIADVSGNLFGTTDYGGAGGNGTVFQIAAGTHALSTLATFNHNSTNGAIPDCTLLADANGNLFGTTSSGGGGPTIHGNVFELSAGTHELSTLATFDVTNGAFPLAQALIVDGSGNLYGTTNGLTRADGTVFEVAAGTHALSTLVTFNGTNGLYPYGGLIADASGNLYGTTSLGGPGGDGTVFELMPVPEPSALVLAVLAVIALLLTGSHYRHSHRTTW